MKNDEMAMEKNELEEEVDEGRMKNDEMAMEKNELEVKLSNVMMRNEQESITKVHLDQQMNELEKEKMMRELEVKELMTKHRNELRNLEMQLSSLKDNECDLQGRIDQLSKERDEALASARDQQPGPRVMEASGETE